MTRLLLCFFTWFKGEHHTCSRRTACSAQWDHTQWPAVSPRPFHTDRLCNFFSLVTAFQKLYFKKLNFLICLWKHIELFNILTLPHCNVQCMLCQVVMLCQVLLLYRGQKSFYPKWIVESYSILNHPKLLWYVWRCTLPGWFCVHRQLHKTIYMQWCINLFSFFLMAKASAKSAFIT